MTERDDLIQRLRNLAEMIPHKHTLPSGYDTVICSLEAFMQIKKLAAEAADALENDVEIPIYDQEVLHYNCTVQVLRNSITGETSVGWLEEKV